MQGCAGHYLGFQETGEWSLLEPDITRHIITGPGKDYTAKLSLREVLGVAERMGVETSVTYFTPETIKGKYIGDSELNVERAVDEVLSEGPSIVFIQDLEMFTPGEIEDEEHSADNQAISDLVKGLFENDDANYFLIATVSGKDDVDPAMVDPARMLYHIVDEG